MCGITFLFEKGCSQQELIGKIHSSTTSLSHRGPDDSDYSISQSLAIGHSRLAVIDLQASRQPMHSIDGRYILSYNGELYNYKELKHKLLSAWQFRTEGDTEVVLAGLATYGPDFLSYMEGMWAFAFWDSHDNRLIMARDRMGEKPLFYQALQQGLACASELPALRKLVTKPWSEDLDSTADYLRYGYYLPGTTAYEQVHELPAGHYLEWAAGGRIETRPYWILPVSGFKGTESEAQELLREKLITAVKRRLVADVEIGVFLSGGIDSSLLTAMLVMHHGISPKSFTIGFDDASYDERRYARLVADHCHTTHFEECFKTWDEQHLERLVLEHAGQPFADQSLLPTSLVSELASRHVKVVLSGDGGDELFSGYQRYQARAILRWYTRLPATIRKNIKMVVNALPEPMQHHSHSLLKKAHLFIDVTDRLEHETPYIAAVNYSLENFSNLVPDLCGRGHQAPALPAECGLDDIHSMMVADALVYLPQDILTKVDRASMSHSLEARAPFLDRDLVELAFSLPRKWHRHRFAGKQMLRSTFHQLLPGQIWRRQKQGFGVPIHSWFRGKLGERLEGLLKDTPSALQNKFIDTLLHQHRKGIRDHGQRLWNIYIYLLWKQQGY